MDDREVVAAIVAGDPAGLGAAYDRYASPLYAYCRSMLREPADAADAVQDTFVIAVAKLPGLRDPGKLRAWLYAVARNECLRRLRATDATSALEEAADLPVDGADLFGEAEQADVRALLRNAIDGLNPAERDVIKLSLGEDLDGEDLAVAMGVSRNHAHALLSRARGQLERSLGALIVARAGRQACPALAAVLTGWDGRMTVLMRKRISRHIEHCDACAARKRRELTPALFAAGLPLAALLPGFREQLLKMCTGHSAAAQAHRASVLAHAGRFGPAGFPKPAGLHRWPWAAQHSHAVAAGAATTATAAAVVAVVAIGGGPPHSGAAAGPGGTVRHDALATAEPGRSPDAQAPAGGHGLAPSASVVATSASGQPAAAGTPGSTGSTGTPGGTGSPGPTSATTSAPDSSPSAASSSPAASPTATSSNNAGGEGTLTISSSTVTLTGGGGTATGSFTITATGGPIQHYNITVRSAHELTVSPSSGSLAAGQTVTITVTANTTAAVSTWIVVDPGGSKVTIQYNGG